MKDELMERLDKEIAGMEKLFADPTKLSDVSGYLRFYKAIRDRLQSNDTNSRLIERTAQIIAHRACCGSEHNPDIGKLHGCCVVCGIPWPCAYAGTPPEDEA